LPVTGIRADGDPEREGCYVAASDRAHTCTLSSHTAAASTIMMSRHTTIIVCSLGS
jgi:hypothetical protein